jgi:hypothetical protein
MSSKMFRGFMPPFFGATGLLQRRRKRVVDAGRVAFERERTICRIASAGCIVKERYNNRTPLY